MGRWQAWVVAGVALLVTAGALVVWVMEPWNPVNLNNCRRITAGMTLEQVEAILGDPEPEWWTSPEGRRDALARILAVGGNSLSWARDGNRIVVSFDGNVRVLAAHFLPTEPPTLRQEVWAWLGWLSEAERDFWVRPSRDAATSPATRRGPGGPANV